MRVRSWLQDELSKESHWLQTVGGIANENIKVGDDKY